MPVIQGDAWQELRREVDRSRRFDQPVTLLGVKVPAPAGGSRLRRDRSTVLDTLAPALRTIDSVWSDAGNVYVLLPGTGVEAAEALVSRLWRELPELLPYNELHRASFPVDGVTAEALRAAVDARPGRRERLRRVRNVAAVSESEPR
jgi:hypothetical protein